MQSTDTANFLDARRDSCQPISEAASALSAVMDIWQQWFPEIDFLETFFKPMWDDETTSGVSQIAQIREVEETTEFSPGEPITEEGRVALVKITLVMTVCAFVVQAMKEGAKTKPDYSSKAWSYVADAMQWLGILQGYISGGSLLKDRAASVMGKLGANAAHAENRAMKAFVMEWCDQNMKLFKSMDAAAEALAGKVVAVKFRTAREWVGEWKKLRSAAKP